MSVSWWRHQLEAFSALLAIYVGNSPVPDAFPAKRPVTRSFDAFFDLHPNKRFSKQWWGWWFDSPSCPLWRHRNGANISGYAVISVVMSACPTHRHSGNSVHKSRQLIENSERWKWLVIKSARKWWIVKTKQILHDGLLQYSHDPPEKYATITTWREVGNSVKLQLPINHILMSRSQSKAL